MNENMKDILWGKKIAIVHCKPAIATSLQTTQGKKINVSFANTNKTKKNNVQEHQQSLGDHDHKHQWNWRKHDHE
jgi:hypothetical protein